MNSVQYDNALKEQAAACPGIIEKIVKGFWSGITKAGFAPVEVLKASRHIYLTGSGDSYSAAMALEPCYVHYLTKLGTNIYVDTALENSRYTRFLAQETPAEAELTLIVAICSGEFSRRTEEVFERAGDLGIPALGITEQSTPPETDAGYFLKVCLPEISCGKPGCSAYVGVLVSASLLAAYMAEAKGDYPEGTTKTLADAMISLGNDYKACMEAFDVQAIRLAKLWGAEIQNFYGVGDGIDMASVRFLASKAIDTAGIFGGFTNSVDWRHNAKYIKKAVETCVVFFGEEDSDSRRSIATAVDEAFHMGFKVVFVGDVTAAEFGIESPVESFQIPKAPKEYGYLTAWFNHLPIDLLVSYFAPFKKKGGCYDT
ncbi:MAG: hypothetical protein K2O16_13660 [Lachnospiraceae bacterium]|nr:hypothetical protein [Lachnospiraceae bacterium]